MVTVSTKVSAKQSSDGHLERIFHKHAGMLCCTACSAPIDFRAQAACDKYFESVSQESKLQDVESALAEPSTKSCD